MPFENGAPARWVEPMRVVERTSLCGIAQRWGTVELTTSVAIPAPIPVWIPVFDTAGLMSRHQSLTLGVTQHTPALIAA
jgi:hypothetical protein